MSKLENAVYALATASERSQRGTRQAGIAFEAVATLSYDLQAVKEEIHKARGEVDVSTLVKLEQRLQKMIDDLGPLANELRTIQDSLPGITDMITKSVDRLLG